MVTYGYGAGGGIVGELGMVMYTLLYSKWIANKDLLYSTWNSTQWHVPVGWERALEEIHTHTCIWLSPFTIRLTLPQLLIGCTATQHKKFKA